MVFEARQKVESVMELSDHHRGSLEDSPWVGKINLPKLSWVKLVERGGKLEIVAI